MPNLSNYGNHFLKFVAISQKQCVYFVHIWNSNFLHIGHHNQVPWAADVSKIKLASVPNLSNYVHYFIIFACFLLIFGTAFHHHRSFMDIKYSLALHKNIVLMPILS